MESQQSSPVLCTVSIRENSPLQNYETIRASAHQHFTELMCIIKQKHRVPSYSDLCEEYNIAGFRIDRIGLTEAAQLHADVIEKCRNKSARRTWCENQLRLFVWLLFHLENAINKKISDFDADNWRQLAGAFVNKTTQDIRFEWLTLAKTSGTMQPWRAHEDEILTSIMKRNDSEGRWNEIAKELFRISNEQYFRKPKQCRERWRNYLDSNINKGQWTREEDCRLLQFAMELGKRWSAIAKCMRDRTEHAVKNRFQSLVKRFGKSERSTRQKKGEAKKRELALIKRILKRLSDSKQESSQEAEPNKSEEEPAVEHRINIIRSEQPPAKRQEGFTPIQTPTVASLEPQFNTSSESAGWVMSPLSPIGITDGNGNWYIATASPNFLSPFMRPVLNFTAASQWLQANPNNFS